MLPQTKDSSAWILVVGATGFRVWGLNLSGLQARVCVRRLQGLGRTASSVSISRVQCGLNDFPEQSLQVCFLLTAH